MHHIAERDRPPIRARIRRAWRETDYTGAREQPTRLADELERTHPGAASSLPEGMEETLTVIRLGIRGKLRRTLESTNPCESLIDRVQLAQRNVKHWSNGEMGLPWTAAGMLEAEKQFRQVIGYTDLPRLAVAIERRLHLPQPNPTRRQRSQSICNDHDRDRRHRSSTATGATSAPNSPTVCEWPMASVADRRTNSAKGGRAARP
jgi:hypothetical protein